MNSKLSIGITSPEIISSYGGAQTHTINIIKILNDFYDIVYFPNPKLYKKNKNKLIEQVKILRDEGIHITKVFDEAIDNNYDFQKILDLYSKENINIFFDLDYIDGFLDNNFSRKLSKISNKPLFLCLQGLGDYNINIFDYLYFSFKIIFTVKNISIIPYLAYNYLNRKLCLLRLNRIRNLGLIFIVNRNYTQNLAIKKKDIHILNPSNGINNINFLNYEYKKEDKIIFFARLTYNKGIFDLIIIIRDILKYYDIKFVIIGNFMHENQERIFFKEIEKYNLKENITYKGFLHNEELYKEISSSKLMIYPSHSDSFSLAIAQALMLHTPVIAYNIAGLQLYNKFKAVKLVREFDFSSMAQKALTILNMDNEEYKNLFNDKIDNFIKEHTWYNVAMQYKKAIDKYKI